MENIIERLENDSLTEPMDYVSISNHNMRIMVALTQDLSKQSLFLHMLFNRDEDNGIILKGIELEDKIGITRKTISKGIKFFINNNIIQKSDKPFYYYFNSDISPSKSGVDHFNKKISDYLYDEKYYYDMRYFFPRKIKIK